jgi:hypothetical protein
MLRVVDPIFVTPRMLPRRWGRADIGEWCAEAPKPRAQIGEVWTFHPGNVTDGGVHFGRYLNSAPQDMLGHLGRCPPALRLVFTDAETDPLFSDAGVALWRILEAGLGASCAAGGAPRGTARLRCQAGDVFRVSDEGWLNFSPGVVALEARASFRPRNEVAPEPPVMRLSRDVWQTRTTLLRDTAMSVEVWRLSEQSRLEPDGATCHVLMSLSPGITLDGRALRKGEAALIPACGRRVQLCGSGAELLVAYPDVVATSIWRCEPERRSRFQGLRRAQAAASARAGAHAPTPATAATTAA